MGKGEAARGNGERKEKKGMKGQEGRRENGR